VNRVLCQWNDGTMKAFKLTLGFVALGPSQ
jgi:hypothetical protein